eukprot:gnl/MRDRNA2_/MRDRNA2_97337_c0_seq1.p1 gnl/MRDRNA2_/MRDRNA2_97337_c0~~gnl/MRDRNA2_/MRDRNA2_97337_c0_seq1.p1  ORF type:complete len:530 (+),score=56.48 gnl/MRDRNA2_/MRDRNA2_97337_c0_seq1:74-1663(+)
MIERADEGSSDIRITQSQVVDSQGPSAEIEGRSNGIMGSMADLMTEASASYQPRSVDIAGMSLARIKRRGSVMGTMARQKWIDAAEATGKRWVILKNKKPRIFDILGPGMLVCLADTDGGGLMTAAESGSLWGYTLINWQIILVPVLYVAQELSMRLGILTRKGLTELIAHHYGPVWGWLLGCTLILTCIGAMMSEMATIAGVGQLYGIPKYVSCSVVMGSLLGIVLMKSYDKVEAIGLAMGACQIVFPFMVVIVRPNLDELATGLTTFPYDDDDYLQLVAANIGAVIMPWMLAYQQSAVRDKGMAVDKMDDSRMDTLVGSIVTQLVVCGMIVSIGATTYFKQGKQVKINKVSQIISALTPTLGSYWARILISVGMVGSSLLAAQVVSICAAWCLSEAQIGSRRRKKMAEGRKQGLSESLIVPDEEAFVSPLDLSPREAPVFYCAYTGVCLIGFVITVSGVNIVWLNISVQIANGMLMPPVVFALWLLCSSGEVLPEEHRIKGWYKWLLLIVFLLCSVICWYSTYQGFS